MNEQSRAIIIAGTIIGAFLFLGMWMFSPNYALTNGDIGLARIDTRTGEIADCSPSKQVCAMIDPGDDVKLEALKISN